MTLPRYITGILGLAILIWGLGTAAVILCASAGNQVDAAMGQHTIFQTEAKIVVYNTPTIAHMADKPEVVVLGASNANLGLRPAQLSPQLDGVPVHNLSIGGQNMRTLSQLVDLIYRQTPPEQHRNIVFVIGAWYGLMIEDKRRWPTGLSDVDQEMLRYGLFRKSGNHEAEFKLPNSFLSASLASVWPLMVPYAWYSELGRYAFNILGKNVLAFGLQNTIIMSWYPSENERNTTVMTDEQFSAEMKSFTAYVGSTTEWGDSGFHDLTALAHRIHDEGGQLVVLDMPLTSWAQKPDLFPLYQTRMQATITPLQDAHMVHYASLLPDFTDTSFFDAVHPRPKVTTEIARLAAEPIRHALETLSSLSTPPSRKNP